MTAPSGDPTYIKNKDQYFLKIAQTVALASSHPQPGGCIFVRDREIVGDGRSIYTASKVEIDCVSYAIGVASKRGVPMVGAIIYTTRYPFSASVFQAYLMGVRRIVVEAHEWEPHFKQEFRRAARLARELNIAIEPLFNDEDQRFTVNTNTEEHLKDNNDLYPSIRPDEFDPTNSSEAEYED